MSFSLQANSTQWDVDSESQIKESKELLKMKCSKPEIWTSHLFISKSELCTEKQSRIRLIGTMQETSDIFLIHFYSVVEVLQQEGINAHLCAFSWAKKMCHYIPAHRQAHVFIGILHICFLAQEAYLAVQMPTGKQNHKCNKLWAKRSNSLLAHIIVYAWNNARRRLEVDDVWSLDQHVPSIDLCINLCWQSWCLVM